MKLGAIDVTIDPKRVEKLRTELERLQRIVSDSPRMLPDDDPRVRRAKEIFEVLYGVPKEGEDGGKPMR